MKKRFSDQQIISILREAEAGVSAREFCRKHAISDATFYICRKKYGSIDMHSRNGRKKARAMPGFVEFLCLRLIRVYACCDRFWLPGKDAHRSRSARNISS